MRFRLEKRGVRSDWISADWWLDQSNERKAEDKMSKAEPEMLRPDSPMATSKLRLSASSAGYVRCSTSGFIGGSTCTWHGSRRILSVTSFTPSSWQPVKSQVFNVSDRYIIMKLNCVVITTSLWRENHAQWQLVLCKSSFLLLEYSVEFLSPCSCNDEEYSKKFRDPNRKRITSKI